jgi:hypothetical protein
MKIQSFSLVLALFPVVALSDEDLCQFPECDCPENIHQPGLAKIMTLLHHLMTCGLYYKTITIVIMTIIVTLQIVASLTIVIDDTS